MSGVLAIVQNIGNAVGVAPVGLVFFGEQDQGLATAFGGSLVTLAGLLLLVAAAALLLPSTSRAANEPAEHTPEG